MVASDIRARSRSFGVQLGATSTFSNAAYVANSSDRYIFQTGTMSAQRTITLPAANTVPIGTQIVVADTSGTVNYAPPGTLSFIQIIPAGADLILNSALKNRTTLINITTAYGHVKLMSDGVSNWLVTHTDQRMQVWLQGANNNLNVVSGTWTPLYFKNANVDTNGQFTIPTANTTVAVASNGAVLPQATINVASTTGFANTGRDYAAITIGGVDTVFGYTGLTGTTFTGCNTGINTSIATGTLATGNVVKQVLVELVPLGGGLMGSIAEASWAASAAGRRGIRHRQIDGTFNFVISESDYMTDNTDQQHIQNTMQPAISSTASSTRLRIEVFQASGGVLACKTDGITAPQWMAAQISE